ncbi:hypothetical protein NC652_026484 [Populus alba x Populus x berolinensis]|nr:hypothetical protein NC652_026484 [Populus alba x Populus x berolinensis]
MSLHITQVLTGEPRVGGLGGRLTHAIHFKFASILELRWSNRVMIPHQMIELSNSRIPIPIQFIKP